MTFAAREHTPIGYQFLFFAKRIYLEVKRGRDVLYDDFVLLAYPGQDTAWAVGAAVPRPLLAQRGRQHHLHAAMVDVRGRQPVSLFLRERDGAIVLQRAAVPGRMERRPVFTPPSPSIPRSVPRPGGAGVLTCRRSVSTLRIKL